MSILKSIETFSSTNFTTKQGLLKEDYLNTMS